MSKRKSKEPRLPSPEAGLSHESGIPGAEANLSDPEKDILRDPEPDLQRKWEKEHPFGSR